MADWNTGMLSLTQELQDELSFSFQKATDGNMHLVNVLYKGVLTDEIGHSYGYFDYSVEAELYAQWKADFYDRLHTEYIIFLDGNIYRGTLKDINNMIKSKE